VGGRGLFDLVLGRLAGDLLKDRLQTGHHHRTRLRGHPCFEVEDSLEVGPVGEPPPLVGPSPLLFGVHGGGPDPGGPAVQLGQGLQLRYLQQLLLGGDVHRRGRNNLDRLLLGELTFAEGFLGLGETSHQLGGVHDVDRPADRALGLVGHVVSGGPVTVPPDVGLGRPKAGQCLAGGPQALDQDELVEHLLGLIPVQRLGVEALHELPESCDQLIK
jgi:hypothetical protein